MARKAKQPRGKKMNPTFFVFCEGKTEAAYVDLLRRSFRVPVEIIAGSAIPIFHSLILTDASVTDLQHRRIRHF